MRKETRKEGLNTVQSKHERRVFTVPVVEHWEGHDV